METMYVTNQLDEIWNPLYDTYEVSAGSAVPQKFQMFINGISATKTIDKTNMVLDKQLMPPESFDVYGVRLNFIGMLREDVEAFCKKYNVQLWIGGKHYTNTKPHLCPGGAGISGYSAVATTATTTTIRDWSVSNGTPHVANVAMFPESHVLKIGIGNTFFLQFESSATLTMTASGATNGQGLYLEAALEGIWRRGVQ